MSLSLIHLIGITLFCLVGGVLVGFFVRKKVVESRIDAIEKYSKKILAEAQRSQFNQKRGGTAGQGYALPDETGV